MRRIATIADKNIQREVALWVKSLRMQGWTDTIYIFSPTGQEPDLPDGCEGVSIDPWWDAPGSRIVAVGNKSACIKPDIFMHFDPDDHVMYMDSADLLVFCPPDEIFDLSKNAHLAGVYFKSRSLKKHFPVKMTQDCGLNLELVDRTKELNSGLIVAKLTPQVIGAMQLWKRMLEYLPEHGEIFDRFGKLGDQALFNYIFRELEVQGLTRFLPDTYNYRGYHKVGQLKVVDGKCVRKSGAEVKVPHAAGIKGMPSKISELIDESDVKRKRVSSVLRDMETIATSVIIPAYKSDWCLGRVLNSVSRQTRLPDELLIGIDACDDTMAAAKDAVPEAIKDRTRVFYFPEHVGCYVNRNTLAEKATGNMLLFFDADDEMLPEYVESMIFPDKNIVMCPRGEYHRDGKKFGRDYIGNAIVGMHKTEFLKIKGFEPWVCAADTEFHQRIKQYGYEEQITDNVIFYRHKHGGNLTESPETKLGSKIRNNYHAIIKKREHYFYRKADFEVSKCDVVIERTSPPVTHIDTFVMIATGRCQLNCNCCTAGKWRKDNRRFHLTVKDLKKFLDVCKKSNYKINLLRISGGEPLLWRNLSKGLRLIRESGVVNKIKMFTNAVAATESNAEIVEAVVENVDRLAISDYGVCPENVKRLQRLCKGNVMVQHVDRRYFNDTTEFHKAPIDVRREEYMPCSCGCRGHTLVGDRVYVCTDAVWMFGWRDPEPGWIWTDVDAGFLGKLPLEQHEDYSFCSFCTANKKVRKTLGKVKT